MKKALITGAAGFVGSHLAEHLINNNIEVTALTHPKHSTENLKVIEKKIKKFEIDLLKKGSYKNIDFNHFDYLFHLAAFSSPAQSFSDPQQIIKNNVFSQINLLQEIVRQKSKVKILIVGSSEEYGNVGKKYLPVNEQTPLAPISPYAVSKVAQDLLGYQFFLNNKLNIIRVRPFNHIGPRQSTSFVVPAFASQIANIERKGAGKISVGNLNTWRDFTDVRDIVKAYLLALDKGTIGEVYNLGSGKAVRIADILSKLISLSSANIHVSHDSTLERKGEIIKIYCDFSKFRNDTGWEPVISLNKTLFDTIEYERNKLRI